jgi:hypothetical protein
MESMKLSVLLLAAAIGASAANLSEIKTVYVLPMANGLDQFLASRLTIGGVLQVVNDPQKADAVITDKIGTGLDEQLTKLYGAKPSDDDKAGASQNFIQPASRARGAIFMVDRKTRNLIWSTYDRPRDTSPDTLNHVADKIASRLAKDIRPK